MKWEPGKFFYKADFSSLTQNGEYKLVVKISGKKYNSDEFGISPNALAMLTIPSVIHYYNKQRANTPTELLVGQSP